MIRGRSCQMQVTLTLWKLPGRPKRATQLPQRRNSIGERLDALRLYGLGGPHLGFGAAPATSGVPCRGRSCSICHHPSMTPALKGSHA